MKKKDLLSSISSYISGDEYSKLNVDVSAKELTKHIIKVSIVSFLIYLLFLIFTTLNINFVDDLSNISINGYTILTSISVGISLIIGGSFLSLYIYNKHKKSEYSPNYLKVSYFFYQIYDIINFIGLFLAIFLWVILFIVTPVEISGGSMEKTLSEGDKVLIWRAGYKPDNSDIIVIEANDNYNFSEETDFVIKRLVANSGDRVSLSSNNIFSVNGVEVRSGISEAEFKHMLTDNSIGKIYELQRDENGNLWAIVPEGFSIVLGDNKTNSVDSKNHLVGLIHNEDILGKAIFRIYPFSKIGITK